MISASVLQEVDRRKSMGEAQQIQVKTNPVLTENHYAFEGDVDSNPGTVIFATKPVDGDSRFLNSGGEFTHTLPVHGKDRWERRRNMAKVIKTEAEKHKLFSREIELDFDGIFERRYMFVRL